MTLFPKFKKWLRRNGFLNNYEYVFNKSGNELLASDSRVGSLEMPAIKVDLNNHYERTSLFHIVGNKLLEVKWISEIKCNRQDEWYEWTGLGKSKSSNFIEEYQMAFPDASLEEIKYINDEIYSLGIKTMSKWESLIHSLDDVFILLNNCDISVILSNGMAEKFRNSELDVIVDYIFINNQTEILIYKAGIFPNSENWRMKIPSNVYFSEIP